MNSVRGQATSRLIMTIAIDINSVRQNGIELQRRSNLMPHIILIISTIITLSINKLQKIFDPNPIQAIMSTRNYMIN